MNISIAETVNVIVVAGAVLNYHFTTTYQFTTHIPLAYHSLYFPTTYAHTTYQSLTYHLPTTHLSPTYQ